MARPAHLALVLAALATLSAACGDHQKTSSAVIGPEGGTVATASGVTLKVAAGALPAATTVTVSEAEPRHGALRRIEVEPRGLALAAPSLVSVQVSGDAASVKLVRIERTEAGEVEHAIETERHNGRDNARQASVDSLGTFEVRGQVACEAACDAGLECDDGACKPHDEVEAADDDGVDDPATHDVGDDHGVDPAPVPGTTPTTCPAGMELDASDGTCKAHGGGTVDPAPSPAPTPAPTTCPDGMELDTSDGTCKAHGGGSSGP